MDDGWCPILESRSWIPDAGSSTQDPGSWMMLVQKRNKGTQSLTSHRQLYPWYEAGTKVVHSSSHGPKLVQSWYKVGAKCHHPYDIRGFHQQLHLATADGLMVAGTHENLVKYP